MTGRMAAAAAVLAAVSLVVWSSPDMPSTRRPVIFCAAGWRIPLEQTLKSTGIEADTVYDGSGRLRALIDIGARCDLFLAADADYLDGVTTQESVALTDQRLVLMLAAGTREPTWEELVGGRRVSLPRADSAAAGRRLKAGLSAKRYAALLAAATVTRPTVVEVANDVARLGAADIGIVWDSTAKAYPDIKTAEVPGARSLVGRVVFARVASDAESKRVYDAMTAELRTASPATPPTPRPSSGRPRLEPRS